MTEQETGSLIYATAFADGMPAPLCALIEAQSKHETDEYSSHAFLKNNNCFGYKFVPGARWQAGPGIRSSEKDPYAMYISIENSVHEICAWILRRKHEGRFPADLATIETPIQYATLLKQCGYFGDPLQNYINGLQHFIKS
jgi:hypothetical protein